MTKKTRRRIDAGLKAKVALESPAGKGDGRWAGSALRGSSNEIYAWKRQLQEQAARPSDAGVGRDAETEHEREIERLHAKIGQLMAEQDFRRQCALLEVARSGVSRPRKPANDNDTALMRRIDELFSAWPFLGSRRMTQTCAQTACS